MGHTIRGMMRNGKDYYSIYTPGGKLVTGVYSSAKAIVLVKYMDSLMGAEPRTTTQLENQIWNYSNGK